MASALFMVAFAMTVCERVQAGYGLVQSTAALTSARGYLSATTLGSKAYFAGGFGSGPSSVVDIYDASTGLWTSHNLSEPRGFLAATSVRNFAMFGGGLSGNGISATVDTYDSTAQSWTQTSLSKERDSLAATSVGVYALFAGGYNNADLSVKTVDVFDSATGLWSTDELSQARDSLAATSVRNYALFGGGWISWDTDNDGETSDRVDIYDSITGEWSTHDLSEPREYLAATTVGDLAIFAGGDDGYFNVSGAVDVFNGATGKWHTEVLPHPRSQLTAASVGDFAFFAGGFDADGYESDVIDIYNGATGEWVTSTLALSEARKELAATFCGNSAIFGGGGSNGIVVDVVSTASPPVVMLSEVVDADSWYIYASASSGDNAGIAAVSFRVGAIDTTSASGARGENDWGDISPGYRDFGGPRHLTLKGTFGFGENTIVADGFNQVDYSLNMDLYNPDHVLWGLGQATVPVAYFNHGAASTVTDTVPNPILIATGQIVPGLMPFIVCGTSTLHFNASGTVTVPATASGALAFNAANSVSTTCAKVYLVGSGGGLPTLTISSSTNMIGQDGAVSLTVTASTTYPGEIVTSISFYDGATLLPNATETSVTGSNVTWSYSWNAAAASLGNHTITATASDNLGQTVTSSAVDIQVNGPPSVTLRTPRDGYIAGESWQIALSATTTNGTPSVVTGVDFYLDGVTQVGHGELVSTGIYSSTWDTTSAPLGTHTLLAKATDGGGLTGTSNIISVVIRIPGDGNGDNIVDGEDYGIWQNGYNHPGATMLTGDYNGDGIVDGEDYGTWQNNYNRTAGLGDHTLSMGQRAGRSETMEDFEESPTGSVTVVCVYTPNGTTWNLYALDQSTYSDGISFVSVKIGNVLTALNVSPKTDSYVGDESGDVQDTFGFDDAHQSNGLGGGAFEIICAQNVSALQAGVTDPNTGCDIFLRGMGQETVTYTLENDDGTQTGKSVAPNQQTFAGITGYWVKIGQGHLTQGEVPVIIPYADGSTAGANFVISGDTATLPAQAEAFVSDE
jgi:hypothetical protein